MKIKNFTLLFLCCNIFFSCLSLPAPSDLELINEKSWLSDFEVIDDKVLIKCRITIKNNTGNDVKYKINAISRDDVDLGLLRNEIIEGYKEDLVTDVFTISANETVEERIIFVGDFAGNYQKHDRLLPKTINIILLE
ncbi:MAG: hypothetical protein LBI28_00510 [Treponema sp.]|nr:hypothetical protein [Treponema sp.]